MGLVGIQHQLSLLLHLGGKVCQLCGSGSILDQVDAVECLQGIGVFLALQHRHTALIISKVGAFGQPLDVEHGSQLFVIGGVLVHTVAVVCTCAGVLGTLDGNGERHIANVVGVVTGGGFNTSTYFVVMDKIAHTDQKVGLASAMAVVLLLLIVIVTYAQKAVEKWLENRSSGVTK